MFAESSSCMLRYNFTHMWVIQKCQHHPFAMFLFLLGLKRSSAKRRCARHKRQHWIGVPAAQEIFATGVRRKTFYLLITASGDEMDPFFKSAS
jgi:hypothetical protein